MAIYLTQYDVKLSDGTRKTFAGPDIDCWDLEEAQDIAFFPYFRLFYDFSLLLSFFRVE